MNFDFNTKYTLENESVLLRPLELSDIENLLHFSINEPELWDYSLLPASNENELKNYIEVALEKRKKQIDYPFIVFDKKTNSYAGSTRFYDIQLTNKSLQLGFTWYGKEYQGTGLNKNCKFLLLEFAFEKMNIERVEFRADYANKKSIAAMKSIGCIEEGVLRSNGVRPNGERRDSIILSILKNEWKNGVKENLFKRL
ncbi:GNAT family protein [uncultured Flavobacterium sp.]|uniref:GNAT family N-acetyltransferase n=1 Tax=uncultured Flavobacterium sp. TaxID=165435 RepID=UPI0030EBD9C1|tara:strand:+ start:37187 stop:37780 length:594 start_codon:yes stop_codon:yes gene_type:complete